MDKGRPQLGARPGSSAARAKIPEKPGYAARAVAVKLVSAVVDKRVSLDGLLDPEHGNPAFRVLGEADRGLVRAILLSTLRRLPQIEAVIAALIDSPLPEGARTLHHILCVSVAQILFLDVPDHSAVDLGVELATADPRSRRYAKLVNAVLRRLVRERVAMAGRAAETDALPTWFSSRLAQVYGAAHAARIGSALLEPAAIDLSVKADPGLWAERLGGIVLPTGGVRLGEGKGSIPLLEGFAEGAWWVQDAAASIPAQLFGDIRGRLVADLCAAPGGKTAQLVLAGAKVTAVEQSRSRLARLSGNLQRLGLTAVLVEADLMDFVPDHPFDAILLDAPCSSTGTVRRHPDVLYTKGPEDIAKLAAVQERLLRKALTMLAPGGRLVFSNCSLDPAEGEDMVARVLASEPGLALVPIRPGLFPGLEEAVTARGEIRTTPAMLADLAGVAGGVDGFYACLIHKN